MTQRMKQQTAIGEIIVEEQDGKITGLALPRDTGAKIKGAAGVTGTPLLRRAFRQLDEYFAGKRRVFDLPLAPRGTPFQLRVLDALAQVPFGALTTYGELARAVGSPGAARAVGMVMNRNPIAIILPCHRVIGTGGSLVGFGAGLPLKRCLLALEGHTF